MSHYIRRIFSFTFTGKSEREKVTSTPPQAGRKRRLSATERDESEEPPSTKKAKGVENGLAGDASDLSGNEESATKEKELEGVKDVTEGVKEVELEDKVQAAATPSCDESTTKQKQKVEENKADGQLEGSTSENGREPDEAKTEPHGTEASVPVSDKNDDAPDPRKKRAPKVARPKAKSKKIPRSKTSDAPVEVAAEGRGSNV